jgi:hypothetical protein
VGGLSLLRVTQAVGAQPVSRFGHPFHAQCGAVAVANQSLAATFISGVHGNSGMNAEASEFASVLRQYCAGTSSMKSRISLPKASALRANNSRIANGVLRTHCLTGTSGKTRSTTTAAV